VLSVPRTVPVLVDYLAGITPSQSKVVWGFWQDEIVYVDLKVPIEIREGPPFQGAVTIVDIEEVVLGTDVSFFSPPTPGHCVGCIEGTGTALIMVDRHSPFKWFLWTPDGAVREGWKGMNGKRSFVRMEDKLNISLPFEYDGRVEQATDEVAQQADT
jgi:hypothetical protein